MKHIAIIGSTGSIGTATLKVCEAHPERFRVVGLAAGRNVRLIATQVRKFKPRVVCLASEKAASALAAQIDARKTKIVWGRDGLNTVATIPEADVLVSAISGAAGLLPTFAGLRAGKDVALANKESLVMAGAILVREAFRRKRSLIPVDSEHSAIAQILNGRGLKDVRRIILTASGGPFLHYTRKQLLQVTPQQALQHPRWRMGNKVTIDSATLMNKGLEVIEAHWLFGIAPERIKVIIHPQSIIHSMVEYIDGTVLAHLSQPDMKGPIAYALSSPERLSDTIQPLDIISVGQLTFLEPDAKRFPALHCAYRALTEGGLMPAVMSAANEVAVQKFLERRIAFPAIVKTIERVMNEFPNVAGLTLEQVLAADRWARIEAEKIIENLH